MLIEPVTHLRSKRQVVGNVTICSGCCCGNVQRHKPEVPVDWLKEEWKMRGLRRTLQLTISRCLGPCDLANVVRISGHEFDMWLGQLSTLAQYEHLLAWAALSASAARIVSLPCELTPLQFDAFVPGSRAGFDTIV
jgi:cobaltochelatase CobN